VGDQSGTVAIFRGVSQEVGPLRLSDVHEVAAGLPVSALPLLVRDRVVETIPASDLSDAEQIVSSLREEACRAHIPTPDPTPTRSPTPPPTPGLTVPSTPGASPSSTALPPAPGLAGPEGPTTIAPTAIPGTAAVTPLTRTPTTPTPTPTPDYPGLECTDS
jgi:PPM family protein phosphatase